MKENRLPVSYVLQMSLYSIDVDRLWKYSSQSKHGPEHNCLLGDLQQVQQCRGGAKRHSLWLQPLGFQMGNTLCYVLVFLPFHRQISPWNHSLILKIKPKHIYLPARLYHSSRLNICFPGCHHVSREPWATCSVSGRKMIVWKWECGIFFSFFAFGFEWEFGGTLACSFNSHCTVNKAENFQQLMIDESLLAQNSPRCFLQKVNLVFPDWVFSRVVSLR